MLRCPHDTTTEIDISSKTRPQCTMHICTHPGCLTITSMTVCCHSCGGTSQSSQIPGGSEIILPLLEQSFSPICVRCQANQHTGPLFDASQIKEARKSDPVRQTVNKWRSDYGLPGKAEPGCIDPRVCARGVVAVVPRAMVSSMRSQAKIDPALFSPAFGPRKDKHYLFIATARPAEVAERLGRILQGAEDDFSPYYEEVLLEYLVTREEIIIEDEEEQVEEQENPAPQEEPHSPPAPLSPIPPPLSEELLSRSSSLSASRDSDPFDVSELPPLEEMALDAAALLYQMDMSDAPPAPGPVDVDFCNVPSDDEEVVVEKRVREPEEEAVHLEVAVPVRKARISFVGDFFSFADNYPLGFFLRKDSELILSMYRKYEPWAMPRGYEARNKQLYVLCPVSGNEATRICERNADLTVMISPSIRCRKTQIASGNDMRLIVMPDGNGEVKRKLLRKPFDREHIMDTLCENASRMLRGE